jgi:hypothetical protein
MKKFTHGIIAVDMINIDDEGNAPIIQFVGYWEEPNEDVINDLRIEFETDESLGLQDQIDDLDLQIAPPEIVEYYNDILKEDGALNPNDFSLN